MPLVRSKEGFTLLEVLFAMAIMSVALVAIFTIEGSSISASDKGKRMNIVAMLAKNKMIETEFDLEGKTFDEVEKDKTGNFEPPFETYTWKRSIKELKFPSIGGGGGDDQNAQVTEMISKLFSNYLSKSLREVTVSIIYHRGEHDQTFSVSTYWVDLNHAFELSE
jgi:general secretion pathway protein I